MRVSVCVCVCPGEGHLLYLDIPVWGSVLTHTRTHIFGQFSHFPPRSVDSAAGPPAYRLKSLRFFPLRVFDKLKGCMPALQLLSLVAIFYMY